MKMNARKICSTFKKEVHKTGGGVRPATPEDSLIQVKDLLNPAELLRDHNLYDSDGMGQMIGEFELPPSSEECPIKQNMSIENIDDVDVGLQEIIPSVISQDNLSAIPAMEKDMNSLPVKIPKRKVILNNNISNGSKHRKNQEDYVSSILNHSKLLKDEEHMRRMEMAEQEHSIKMKICEEKLKSAVLEREILELRKAHEVVNKL